MNEYRFIFVKKKMAYMIFVMLIFSILSCQLKIISVYRHNAQKKFHNL